MKFFYCAKDIDESNSLRNVAKKVLKNFQHYFKSQRCTKQKGIDRRSVIMQTILQANMILNFF